ncbi:MAG: cytochrome c oxidase subunit II [Candidatus Bathyarchaeia archaeon]
MSQPMPPSAIEWNNFFNLATTIAFVALGIVVAAMIYFTVKYREKKGQTKFFQEKHLTKTRARDAVIFATISIIILFSLTVAGDQLTPNARFQPAVSQSLVIHVTAYQWDFRFEYPNGANSTRQLYLPGNTTVMFNVTSTDVMHNFYLVQYRVSIDAIPGRYNIIWITTPPVNGTSELTYKIICKELCGPGHPYMETPLTVMSQTAFNQWLSNQTTTNSTAGG